MRNLMFATSRGFGGTCAVAAASFVCAAYLPQRASAQTCDDVGSQGLLSNGWFLAEGHCAVDKLVDIGEDALKEAAKELLKTAIDMYLPSLGDLLNFGQDPFAADVQRILNAIQGADQDVLNAIWCDRVNQANKVSMPSVQEEFGDTVLYQPAPGSSEPPIIYQIGEVPKFVSVENDLNTLRNTFRNLDALFGLDAIHSLVTITQMSIEAASQASYVYALSGYLQAHPTMDLDDFTTSDFIAVDGLASGGRNGKYQDIISSSSNGIVPYFDQLARNNTYRTYNDNSFSAPGGYDSAGLGSFCDRFGNNCVYHDVTNYSVTSGTSACKKPDASRPDTWTDGFASSSQKFAIKNLGPMVPPGTCVVRGATISLPTTRLAVTLPDGTLITEDAYHFCTVNSSGQLIGFIDADTAIRKLMNKHKLWAHRRNLLTSLGAVRPIFDRWNALVGSSEPGSTLAGDMDLDAYVLRKFNANAEVLADQNADRVKNPVRDEVSDFLGSVPEAPTLEWLSPADSRSLTNFVLASGASALNDVVSNANAQDSLGVHFEEMMSVIGSGTSDYAGAFAGWFAAKAVSIL